MSPRGASKKANVKSGAASLVGTVAQVKIERVVPGGFGLAHHAGHTVFVALAAPDDCLRVRFDRVQGQLAFASIVEIVRPSSQRVEPPCPYFGRCGGCDFQQLSYQAQLAAKLEIVRDCLRRIAKFEAPPGLRIVAAPEPWRYRARAQWQFDAGRKVCGYFERGTHRIVDVDVCPVLVPELQTLLARVREDLRRGSAAGELQAVAGDDGVAVTSSENNGAAATVSRRIGGEQYFFSADGFFQINQQLLQTLVDEAVSDAGGALAVDLYCGVGLFSLPLARRFARVVGVEGNAGAVALAERNAGHAALDNVEFVAAGVEQWLAGRKEILHDIDLVLLDPPRAGAGKEVVASIVRLAPRRVVYVSCDPATLARDLRAFVADGYHLDALTALDMFPQTHHVETVARLRRGEL